MNRKAAKRAAGGHPADPVEIGTPAPSSDDQPVASGAQPLVAYPHDPSLLLQRQRQWLRGDWASLVQMPAETLAHHPDRARLALLGAGAFAQLDDRAAAREWAHRALQWGCGREELGRVLLQGLHHTLARASMAAARHVDGEQHLSRSLPEGGMGFEARRILQSRREQILAELRNTVEAEVARRKVGSRWVEPRWLLGLADACLAADDLHDAIDRVVADMLGAADDRLQFFMILSDRLKGRQDKATALHFLNMARACADAAGADLKAELARKLAALGRADHAMDLMVDRVLTGGTDAGLDAALARQLVTNYHKSRGEAEARAEHGHQVLLDHLADHLPVLQAAAGGRSLTLIEIGTTRELVPGQGSTRRFAQFCLQHGIRFVTVDMDPHNARMARELFDSLGANFEAVAMKGEDYLRQHQGDIDAVFLDAYDFDHGHHSDLRQSRYLKYLGSKIDDRQCHEMHLDCAQTLARRLSPFGLVCIDDTWLDAGRWTAKGTLAMPFLLDHGFRLLEARNHAALLNRSANEKAALNPGTAGQPPGG